MGDEGDLQDDRALRSMVGVLRPGGWLRVEDAEPALEPLSSLDPKGPPDELANTLRTGFRALLAERGVDPAYGRKLPRLLRNAGLVDLVQPPMVSAWGRRA